MAPASKGTAARSAPGNNEGPGEGCGQAGHLSPRSPPSSKKKAVTVVKKAATATKKPAATAKKAHRRQEGRPSSPRRPPPRRRLRRGRRRPGAQDGGRRPTSLPRRKTATAKKATTRWRTTAPGLARRGSAPRPKAAAVRPKTGPYAKDAKFLEEVRELLQADRAIYQEQATSLRAEADSLALEREPGDVQFDEESGEGGTVTVDRERNLALSGQATLAVEEIDDALARIDDKTYGYVRAVLPAHPQAPAAGPALCPPLRGVQDRGSVAALNRPRVLAFAIAVVVVVLDRVTTRSPWTTSTGPHVWGPFGLALTYNSGFAFSLFSGRAGWSRRCWAWAWSCSPWWWPVCVPCRWRWGRSGPRRCRRQSQRAHHRRPRRAGARLRHPGLLADIQPGRRVRHRRRHDRHRRPCSSVAGKGWRRGHAG